MALTRNLYRFFSTRSSHLNVSSSADVSPTVSQPPEVRHVPVRIDRDRAVVTHVVLYSSRHLVTLDDKSLKSARYYPTQSVINLAQIYLLPNFPPFLLRSCRSMTYLMISSPPSLCGFFQETTHDFAKTSVTSTSSGSLGTPKNRPTNRQPSALTVVTVPWRVVFFRL